MNRMADPRRHLTRSGVAATLVVELAFVALFAAGCAVERPSAPSTEFTMSIPVADDSTRVRDVVGDRSEFLQTDPTTGGMLVHFSKDVGVAEIGDRLKVRTQSASFSESLPAIDVRTPGLPEMKVPVSMPGGAGSTQDLPVIPLNEQLSLAVDVSEPLEVQSGRLEVSVKNNTPVAWEELSVSVLGAQVSLGRIEPGSSGQGEVEISNQELGSNLQVGVVGRTAAARAVVPADPGLAITLVLKELVVVFPPQEFASPELSVALPTEQPIRIQSAEFSGGELSFAVVNETPLPLRSLYITLRDLRRGPESIRIAVIESLAPGASISVATNDLTGVEYRPEEPGELVLSFRGETAPATLSVPYKQSGGSVGVGMDAQDMSFERVTGWLNGLPVPMETVEREVDFPNGLDNVELSAASLDIYVTSAIAFLADVDLRVTGTNRSGQTRTLSVEERFERGDPSAPTSHVLSVSPGALVDLLNLLPTHVTITPEVKVGDGQQVESITRAQWVSVDSVVFRTASRLSVTAATQIDPDPRDITFRDSQAKERVDSHWRSARIITEVENSLPLGIGVRLFVGRTPEAVYDTGSRDHVLTIPALTEEPFHADAPAVDAQGHSVGSTRNARELELTKEQVLKFILEDDDRGKLWSGVRIYLPATAGAVEIRDSDFVNTVAGLKVELLLDKNLVD